MQALRTGAALALRQLTGIPANKIKMSDEKISFK